MTDSVAAVDAIAEAGALFVLDDDEYVPSRLTEGPWDPGSQFGGAPSALMATLVEQTPTLAPMQITRMTVDLLRPVPMVPLRGKVDVVREGKRIQVVDAALWAGTTEVARCSAMRVRTTDLGTIELPTGETPVDLPQAPLEVDEVVFPGREQPGSRWAVEYLFEGRGGYVRDPMWVRLRVPVVAGQSPGPMAQLAFLADLVNGIGNGQGGGVMGINTDVSVNVLRYPVGDWVCLSGFSLTSRNGIGHSFATASDTRGTVASIAMSRLVDPE
jgi:hypothetical protein